MKYLLTLGLLLSINSYAFSRAPNPTASTSPVPSVAASPSPTGTPGNVPLSLGTVSVVCTNCTVAQNKLLPTILSTYIATRDSQCFSDYYSAQPRIDENQGLSAAQIVTKLRNTPVKTTLTFYDVAWVLRWTHPECGADNTDGTISWKVTCFDSYTACKRASFMGHEFSHGMGFTHYTAGNQAKGNEETVPYLVDEAFAACCH